MGKSTSAQILAREKGYVYYEADTFGMIKNPFIYLNVDNPSMAQMKQKNLKGPGAKERSDVIREVNSEWPLMMQGLDFDMDKVKRFYRELTGDIRTQKERIGGHWAVAHVVFSREIRDMMR